MSYFYGPVPSRRLGFSLGVNLLPKKVCSFDCLYCQLGGTEKKIMRRFSFVNLNKLTTDIKPIIKAYPNIDYITIAGSGEPTLHKDLDKIISRLKKATQNKYPVCVITNSSLLYRKDVRKELLLADLIIPSLDSVTEETFSKINRPHEKVGLDKILDGLFKLKKEFHGKLWLEIMLMEGFNCNIKEANKFRKIIKELKPDKVQLNIPMRPSGLNIVIPDVDKVKKIKRLILEGSEIVSEFKKKKESGYRLCSKKGSILRFLKVRPGTVKDLSRALNIVSKDVIRQLNVLIDEQLVKESVRGKNKYFVSND
ncbi:MAG: radical SAM protein [Candidatus Omnitrophica bacterium]|nr:radical SAM protein [Candidatus Omnitrophota bacterium]